ncbi:META domain-containing protein [Octadecabacter ascidiaceicola]|uniref:META domain protein n=1 Tax=Octadecabacter ascidiaceicola TaxID=1655543 RepID=A0A238KCL8_9RHOB|nr:META domain-containing protein [Octadecabacter ascidiaceicola]SMX39786.1 META domain protein [Octadecabacter ascidiaceicola]
MLKLITALLPLLFASACFPDESISGFVEPTAEYHLVEIDGAPFDGTATIAFPEPGRVAGQAPCNRYFAAQTADYPWFALDGIGASRMACPDLNLESAFFTALEDMTLAEVSGDTLILSNTGGRQMVFVAR